jgi:hypothetical protein
MRLLKTIWLLIKKLFKRKPKQTIITVKEVMDYVEETPHLRNSYKKSLAKREQEERAENNANKKKIAKKKQQKNARKKNRK